MDPSNSRRSFLHNVAFGSLAAIAVDSWTEAGDAAPDASVLGDSGVATSERPKKLWKPVSDRKIRVGIAGYGVCQFGFEDRPNVPGVAPGGHGGSHGHLMNEFVTAIFEDRKPQVDLTTALNLTVPGIVAHQSAINGGETRKIPVFA